MARYSKTLTRVFEAYGSDADAALAAYANVDPEGWSTYVEQAARKQYRSDYRNFTRQLTVSVAKERLAERTGQVKLFEPGDDGARVEIRQRIVFEGTEYELPALAGHDGAQVIRKVAERDLAPALTTVARSRTLLRLADHIDTETERLERPVSVGEVLGWAA